MSASSSTHAHSISVCVSVRSIARSTLEIKYSVRVLECACISVFALECACICVFVLECACISVFVSECACISVFVLECACICVLVFLSINHRVCV